MKHPILLTLLLFGLFGCSSGKSVQELQKGYVDAADELELRINDMIEMRDELAEIWQFAIDQKRGKNVQAMFRFYHDNDKKDRLKHMEAAVVSVQTQLQDLGLYSSDPTHKEWHRDLADIYAQYTRGVNNTTDGKGSTLASFKAETEKFRVDLLTKISTLSITLKVPTT